MKTTHYIWRLLKRADEAMNSNSIKRKLLICLSPLLYLGLPGCTTPPAAAPAPEKAHPQTFSSFDVTSDSSEKTPFPPGSLNFQNAELSQVLAIYQEISKRTVIHPSALPSPKISVRSETPLNRVQALQLLDTVLAQNGIVMVLAGDTAVKAVPEGRAPSESPPEISLPWRSLPDSGSYMKRTVQLKKHRPSELVPVLVPLSRTPNAILPIDERGQLILRDYSSNIRQMLQLIEDLEKNASR